MKKALSLLLCLAMCLSIFPIGAIAEETEIQTAPEAKTVFPELPEVMPEAEAYGEALPTQEEIIIFTEPAEIIPMSEPENYEGIVEILTIPEPEGFEEPETEVISAAEIEAVSVCGEDLVWTLDAQGTLTVAGTGEMFNFADADEAPWYSCSSSIKAAVIESGVTSIGELAFTSCENLVKIEIADSVVSIGEGAFSECRALSEVIYSGTEADWGNIVIESDNEPLVGSKFIFISEEASPEEAISEEAIPEEAEELSAAANQALDAPVVTLTVNVESGAPILSWTSVDGAVKYEVWVHTAAAGKYELKATLTDIEYTDDEALVGEARNYQIRAVSADGKTTKSPIVYNKRKLIAPTVSLTVNESGAPVLSWPAVGGAVKYEVFEYDTALKKFVVKATVEDTEYTDEEAPIDVGCNYKVRSLGEGEKYSDYSSIIYNKRTFLAPVVSLTVDDSGAPVLSWPNVFGAVKYEVWVHTAAAGKYELKATVTDTEYTDEEALVGEARNYQVRAVTATGKTTKSPIVYNKRKLIAPTVSLTVNESGAPVLSWPAVGGAVKYEVFEYDTALKKFVVKATVEDTEYTDEEAPIDVGCNYKVRSLGEGEKYSDYSSIIYNKRTFLAPVVSLTVDDSGAPVLSWPNVFGAVKYEVWVHTAAAGKYELKATVTDTEYTDEEALVGEARNYQVRAVTATGKTTKSPIVYNKRKLIAPTVSLTVNESGAPVLSWPAVGGAVKYEVFEYDTALKKFVVKATVEDTEYTDEEAPIDVGCNYKVRSLGEGEKYSDYSSIIYNKRTFLAPVVSLTVDDSGAPVLSWPNVFGAVKYEVWVHTAAAGKYELKATVTDTEYTDEEALVGEARNYQVRAVTANGKTTKSSVIYNKRKLVAPTVSLTVNESGAPVLSWPAVGGAVKYEVFEYDTALKKFVVKATVEDTEYTDEEAPIDVGCNYKVRSVGEGEKYSDYCATIYNKRTFLAPVVSLAESESGAAVLSWPSVFGAVKYEVWVHTAAAGQYELKATLTDTEYTDEEAPVGEARNYQIRAVTETGKTTKSSVIYNKRKFIAPVGPIVQDGVEYEQTENGMKIVGFTLTDSDVVIPATVNDIPVTEVGASAFEDCTTLVSIDLPDSIAVIGERAFAGCVNLSSMN